MGCEKLDFSPTLTVKPDLPNASTSSGLTVDVKVPQEATENPVGLSEADMRDATVMLPPGVALNPAGANGLEACSAILGRWRGVSWVVRADRDRLQGMKPRRLSLA